MSYSARGDEVLFEREGAVLSLTRRWHQFEEHEQRDDDIQGHEQWWLELEDRENDYYGFLERLDILQLRRWHRIIGEAIQDIEETAKELGVEIPEGEAK